MGEVSIARGSLKMPFLLFALLSTALAVPAPCPPMPPMDCGEGMTNCPGDIDPMGCMMPEICVAEGDECPFFCPHNPPSNCEEYGLKTCPGDIDIMGCSQPDLCNAPEDECPFFCPYMPSTFCGEGMINCPGPIDIMGCMGPDGCMAEGEECPFHCPPMMPMDCEEYGL